MSPSKKPPAALHVREFKLRLPPDVSERVENEAANTGLPQNRVIINDLAATPALREQRALGEQVTEMKIVLARYGAQIVWHELADDLLKAVDGVLAAKSSGELQGAMERLKVARLATLRTPRP
jgi:hypothetical protein